MVFRERLAHFLDRYHPDQLLNTLQELLENLIENIKESSNITLQILLSPVLLLAIFLLYPVMLLRKLLANLIILLKDLYRLVRKLFLISVQEVNAYWIRTSREGRALSGYLQSSTQKMLEYIQYLWGSIIKGDAAYEVSDTISNEELFQQVATRFFIWFCFGSLSMLMTFILIPTFIFGVPLLHRKFTGDFPITRPPEGDESYRITFFDGY